MLTRSLLLCSILSLTACASLDREAPVASTPDGLALVESNDFDVLYIRPDADFSAYDTVYIAAPAVEFVSDWKRKQNQRDPGRVTDSDMDRIRQMVSEQAVEVFAREIAEGTNYRIVDSPDAAALVLTPEITKLDIINPLNNQPYRITVLAENTGSMTMNAELIESESGLALLRFTDKSRGTEYLDFRRQDAVRLRFENERVMRRWAQSLNAILVDADSLG